jgi:hypothetical protein
MNLAMTEVSQNLLSCIEQAMMDWAFLSVDYLGEPSQQQSRLPLERKVRLRGEHCEVALVMRGSQGLGKELARGVKGRPASEGDAGEAAFNEWCQALAEEWRKRQAAEKGLQWKAQPAEPSMPDSWPAGPPDAAVVTTSNGWALEVLLWSPSGPIYATA